MWFHTASGLFWPGGWGGCIPYPPDCQSFPFEVRGVLSSTVLTLFLIPFLCFVFIIFFLAFSRSVSVGFLYIQVSTANKKLNRRERQKSKKKSLKFSKHQTHSANFSTKKKRNKFHS